MRTTVALVYLILNDQYDEFDSNDWSSVEATATVLVQAERAE